MLRVLIRPFVSPGAIAVMNLAILVPLLLSIVSVSTSLFHHEDIHREALDIIEGMGVILIGWGVAIEERSALRAIFELTEQDGEARQAAIDHACHAAGIGLLIFGLFAEMCIEAIRLPNHIINTVGINELLLGTGLIFMVVCVWILVRTTIGLIGYAFGLGAAANHPAKPH